jgi:hypothetical protein
VPISDQWFRKALGQLVCKLIHPFVMRGFDVSMHCAQVSVLGDTRDTMDRLGSNLGMSGCGVR